MATAEKLVWIETNWMMVNFVSVKMHKEDGEGKR